MVVTYVRYVFDIDFLQHLLAANMIGWIFGLLIFEMYIQSESTIVKILSFTYTQITFNYIFLYFHNQNDIRQSININLSNFGNFGSNLQVNTFVDVDYPNCNGCKVHKGFYEAFGLQQKLVEQNLNSLLKKYPNAPIHVTGHSLGGAIATLIAAHLSLRNYKLAPVYTYGQPRVGNKKFAAWFNSRITEYRIIHNKDIVPNLPPRNNYIKRISGAHYKSLHSMQLQSHQGLLDFEYHHEGTQVWFSAGMKKYRICNGEDMSCYNSIKTLDPMDHLKKYYLEVPESGSPVAHFSATNQKIHY